MQARHLQQITYLNIKARNLTDLVDQKGLTAGHALNIYPTSRYALNTRLDPGMY